MPLLLLLLSDAISGFFFVLSQVLPDQQHCYYMNGDAPVQDGHALQGVLVTKIPFRHPAQVPLLLDIIRHQAAYNNLIGSCVKRTSIKEGEYLPSDSCYCECDILGPVGGGVQACIWLINNMYSVICADLVLLLLFPPQIVPACCSLKYVL